MKKNLKHSKQGSALLLTLLIVSLLLVIVLSFTVFVRLQLREVTNSHQRTIARQNAKIGLDLAIAQLQKYTGADQRITAPATTVYPQKDVTRGDGPLYDDSTTGYRSFAQVSTQRSYLDKVATYLVPSERVDWEQAMRNWWNGSGSSRNPHWVAAFDSSLRVDRASNPNGTPVDITPALSYEEGGDPVYGEPKRDQLPVWLVSGNDQYNIDPRNDTSYPSGYLTPEISLVDNPEAVELVGTGSAASAATSVDGLDGTVRALKQDITGNQGAVGSYAYWVGDESLKANFSLRDPYTSASPGSVEYRNRLQVPQRLGWERIQGLAGSTIDPNNPLLERLSSTQQIPLAIPDTRPALRNAFHHLTSYSQSLFTNTALGGLKKDLTRYLDDGDGLSDNDPIPDASLYDPQDPRFKAWNGSNHGFPSDADVEGLPTWGQVRTWYQNTGNAGGAVTPNADTAPILTYVKLHNGISYDPGTQTLRWHWVPALVLWNPYEVSLASASYEVEIHTSPNFWKFNLANISPSLSELQNDADAEWDMRLVGPEISPGVRQNVRSFRSPQTNPEVGGNYWPQITHTNPLYEGGNYGSGTGQSSLPDAYNIGRLGPFTYDQDFGDGTTDGFGRLYYNLRHTTEMDGHVRNPDKGGNSPSTAASDPSKFKDEGGMHGSGSDADAGKRWLEGMRVAPMHPTGDSDNFPPFDTPLRFKITSGFSPGESRIFSLSTPVDWDPNLGIPVQLQAGFESDFPGSVHFPVYEVVNGPSSASGLRFYAENLSSSRIAPMVKLKLNGDLIMQSESFAGDNAINGQALVSKNLIAYGTWYNGDADGDGVKNGLEDVPAFLEEWRIVYDTDDFHDHIQPYVQDTGDKRSAIWDWGEHYLTPFTANGGGSASDIHKHTPMFSRFNAFAKEMNRHPLLDQIRDRYGSNNINGSGNVEGLSQIDLYATFSKGATPQWDNNQYTGQNGFSMITYRERAGDDYQALVELPVLLTRRPLSNLLSLGQLQQINLSPYSWQPAKPIGNSWAGVYNDREAIAGIHSRIPGIKNSWALGTVPRVPQKIPNSMAFSFTGKNKSNQPNGVVEVPANSMLDMSFVLNENIWDRFFLSTLPSSPNLTDPLANSRHRYAESAYSHLPELSGFDTAAAHLRNHGALNVNSTSVEAWKALLTAFRDLSLGDNPADTVPVTRTLDPIGDAIEFTLSGIDDDDIGASSNERDYSQLFNGFRYLDDEMIEVLAERIVDEIRLRGPFYSMSDFVNRRLNAPEGSGQSGSDWVDARTDGWSSLSSHEGSNIYTDFIDPTYDPFVGLHGLSGPLQRAIDLSGINGGVNHPDFGDDGAGSGNDDDRVFTPRIRNSLNGPVDEQSSSQDFRSSGIGKSSNTRSKHTIEPTKRSHVDTEHLAGAPAGEAGMLFQGMPGFITQADLLTMLGPALTPRGDTFLIRAYGESDSNDSANARVWLEAVVQRITEPVHASSSDPYRPESKFGRRYKIVSMRWLTPDEI
ncbi:hypothetical protein P0Y35_09775 [Kiritimatiellaeota bacterium B1221]|nr:hypothetical protein [Kiritimatiellaeota bacterium B1221]